MKAAIVLLDMNTEKFNVHFLYGASCIEQAAEGVKQIRDAGGICTKVFFDEEAALALKMQEQIYGGQNVFY